MYSLIFLLCAGLVRFAASQTNCTRVNLVSRLGSTEGEEVMGLVSDSLVSGQGAPPPVQILSYQFVCLAVDNLRGTYTSTSIVVSYNSNAVTLLSQFEYSCVDGAWEGTVNGNTDNTAITPADGDLNTNTMRSCIACRSPILVTGAGATTHCVSCPTSISCTTGLMQCTGISPVCCNFYENDMCVAECTSPLVPYEDFTCATTTEMMVETTTAGSTNANVNSNGGLSPGAIVGIVIGCLVAVALVVAVVIAIIFGIKQSQKKSIGVA